KLNKHLFKGKKKEKRKRKVIAPIRNGSFLVYVRVCVFVCVCVCLFSYNYWHGGSVACTACTAASQQEGHGFDSRMGCGWLWGAGPPQSAQCSGGLSPGPFCVEFACSP